ncbi:MAG TPA: carboxypeptidase regulatory-like domain-containing protein [Gemmatimonadaceae bacterium]|nr:carboxypeptidase regulatory-like domain-containing protein [Gemmatimonadaceae bacterium]
MIDHARQKVLLPALLFLAISGGGVAAQVSPGTAPSTVVQGGVTVTGTVMAEAGFPLPYSTVTIDAIGRERFTDQTGTFTYYAVPAGKYRVRIRQLGYIPVDTSITVQAGMARVSFVMSKIATALAEVQVSAPPRRCIVPMPDGFVDDPELATVLTEARKNADRERLLRRTYPFEYRLAQSHDTYDPIANTHSIRYDTTTFRSDDNWRYRKGRVVGDDRSKLFGEIRVMRLPTLSDLSDRSFLTAHCFKYAGIVQQAGFATHQIDFAPDSSIIAPDVEGSIFIDSATYLIRRAEFRLTRGGTVTPAILGMVVTTTYREILPNVALFDEISSVQPLPPPVPGAKPPEFREHQRLLSFRFIRGGPPGTDGHKWISAAQLRGDSAASSAVSPASAATEPPPPRNK